MNIFKRTIIHFEKKFSYFRAKHLKEINYEHYLIKLYAKRMRARSYTIGKTLSFENPITFSEKCQWLKLYDQDERKPMYSDKIRVRDYVEKIIGSELLVPIIDVEGIYYFENAFDIDFNKLPNEFVLKCNHGSHMNVVVKNKTLLTNRQITLIKKKLNKWLKIDFMFMYGLETQYRGIKPKIYIEKYMNFENSLRDYKFLCFNGVPKFLWMNEECVSLNSTTTAYDLNYKKLDFNMNLGYKPDNKDQSKPKNFDRMVEIVKKLCADFTFVRVDLLLSNGSIYFSELTFNSAAGFDVPYPVNYDKTVGDMLQIEISKRSKFKGIYYK